MGDDRLPFERADDGSEAIARGIDQHRAAGERKLARLAAHFVVAAARGPGRTRNTDGLQQLSRRERHFERAGYELIEGYASAMAAVGDDAFGLEGEQGGEPIARGV